MDAVTPFPTFDKYHRSLGRRGRVTLFQLPLSVTMVLVVILAETFRPGLLQPGPFLYSLGAHLLLLAACALVPWDRLPGRAWMTIPVLDCLAIGFTREAADEYLTVLGFLLVFPVIWLSLGRHRSGILIAVTATILSAVLPLSILGTGVSGPSFIRIVLLPVILGAISLTAHVVFNAVLRQRLQLEQQDRKLQELLTASEKREQLLGTIMDTVSVGVCAVDDQGRKILMNRQQTRHIASALGEDPLTPESEDIPLYSVDRKTRLPPDRHPLHRAANGEAFTDELIWFGTGSGQRAYSITCRVTKDRAGNRSSAVLSFADVTALVQALAAKDQFVASVSHELRTPLTSIMGYLDLALDEYPDQDPELMQYLAVARRNAERLLHLVSDLLTIASDTLAINPKPADLMDVIRHSVESANPRADAANISLHLEPAGPAVGKFDTARIGQVIDNLLSNAIKYTPDGGTVTIRASKDGENLTCEVADTGIGMTDTEQAQAFTRFFRAERAHSSTIPGAGLGLPITKTIIENHGGTISLDSKPGEGTTVTLTLPGSVGEPTQSPT